MPESPPLYLLAVGIDKWTSDIVGDLQGCENDVRLITQVFRERFGVSEDKIKTLLGADATRAGIEAAFRSHLIDRAKAWKKSGSEGPSPAFVFHYSGHGSRTKDASGTQPDGWDETLVSQDSRVGDVYDIKDWEFAQWLRELTDHSDNVTILLDSCHSGGATRDTESIGTIRECPADLRVQPLPRPANQATSTITSKTRSTESGADLPYLLLAACQNHESAAEYPITQAINAAAGPDKKLVPNAKTTVEDPNQIRLGAFTWFLANELLSLPKDSVVDYRDVFERVRYEVHSKYRSQMPQIRGNQDRQLFGGASIQRDAFAAVTRLNKHTVTVNAGSLHGLTKESELLVYPPSTKTLAHAGEPVTRLVVQYLEATLCRCRPKPTAPVLLHSKVLLPPPFSGAKRKLVAIEIDDHSFAQELKQKLATGNAAPYINVSCVETSNPTVGGDFRITRHGNRLWLRDTAGKLLASPESETEIPLLSQNLKTICTYHNALDHRNHSPGSALRGKVKIKFHLVDGPDSDYDDVAGSGRNIFSIIDMPQTSSGTPIVEMGKSFVIEVINNSDKRLYARLSSFGFDFAVYPLDTTSDEKPIDPQKSKWYARDLTVCRYPLKFHAPDGIPATETLEHLKVIVSEDENMLPSFDQAGLKLPSDEDLNEGDSTKRALMSKPPASDRHDWTTVECEYLVVPPASESRTMAPGGQSIAIPKYDLKVHPPSGSSWEVGVMTQTQSSRCTPADSPLRPSGMIWGSELAKPIGVSASKLTAPLGDALSIAAEASAFEKLSEEDPFILSLPENKTGNQQKVAVAWDGSCCYPVGMSDNADLGLTWMPSCDGAIDLSLEQGYQDLADTAGKRGLLRTTKLYLYGLVGHKPSDLGLHQSRFVPPECVSTDELLPGERVVPVMGGQARMRKIERKMELRGKRVAVIVHGFSSDGFNTLAQLSILIPEQLNQYDAVLTFDYESFATPLSESARLLSESMTLAGFAGDDGAEVDVFATGMGCIVARSMIEQHAKASFVDRCFFAGPPNQGTKLLNYTKAVPWIGTALVNAAGPNPVSLFLSAAMKKITRDAVTLTDLRPGSELLRGLNAAGSKPPVPYHIVAGLFNANDTNEPRWYRAASMLADFGMDQFFSDQHDLIVDTASMTGIEDSKVKIQQVDCSHFDYFQNANVGSALSTWLGS